MGDEECCSRETRDRKAKLDKCPTADGGVAWASGSIEWVDSKAPHPQRMLSVLGDGQLVRSESQDGNEEKMKS